MKIQDIVTQSNTDSAPLINFSNSSVDQDTWETIALVQRVMEDAGTDKHTFCLWLLSSKVKAGKPLTGICHWFMHLEKTQRTGLVSHLPETMSISTIMVLATVLFILLIKCIFTCIIWKRIWRRRQHLTLDIQRITAPMSNIVRRMIDKPPDYNSVIQMKEREEEELPSYSQAVSALDSCDFVITSQFF